MRSHLRVLVVGPELIWSWTESTARALEGLGCSVAMMYYNQSRMRRRIWGVRHLIGERFGWQMPNVPLWLQEKYLLCSNLRKAQAMLRRARAFRPDLILILKGESLKAGLLAKMKEVTRATLAVWWMDHPLMNAESGHRWREVPRCLPMFDACFVFDHTYESALCEAGARTVQFLPCTVDPDLFVPQKLTPADQVAYGASISFVGSYYESRGHLLSALGEDSGVRVWGSGWERFVAAKSNGIDKQFGEEASFPSETCKIYNASLMNLNSHHPQSRLAGLNCRAFEIPAAGGFQLTDYVPGMEALLEPNREVAVYRSPEEAADLARYYIKADEERQRIAAAGHKRVLAEHTYRHRMKTLLDVVAR